jgi:hypothetical protein
MENLLAIWGGNVRQAKPSPAGAIHIAPDSTGVLNEGKSAAVD